MANRKIIIENGDVFNRLTVVNSEPTKEQKPDSLKKRRCVQCVCDCGRLTFVVPEKLKSGHTTSCGCYQQENRGGVVLHTDYAKSRFSMYGGLSLQDVRIQEIPDTLSMVLEE